MMCSRCGRAKSNPSTGFCTPCEQHHRTAVELSKRYKQEQERR